MEIYQVVALAQDLPRDGLIRGQVGTVVEVHDHDIYEVEFADADGIMYALAPIPGDLLIPLIYAPAQHSLNVP